MVSITECPSFDGWTLNEKRMSHTVTEQTCAASPRSSPARKTEGLLELMRQRWVLSAPRVERNSRREDERAQAGSARGLGLANCLAIDL